MATSKHGGDVVVVGHKTGDAVVRLRRGTFSSQPRPGDTARVERVTRLLLPTSTRLVEDPSVAAASAGGVGSYLPFPTLATSRLLVPLDSPVAAAAALRLRTPTTRSRLSVAYRVAAGALEAGVLQRLLTTRVDVSPGAVAGACPDSSLVDHVAEILGRRVLLSARVGPPDPHRTVGMHALSPDGGLLAFVKVASEGLAGRQLQTEAQALAAVGAVDSPVLRVPKLLHEGGWNGLRVLVTTALDLVGSRQPNAARSPGAQLLQEVRRSGRQETAALSRSAYWLSTRRRLDDLVRAGTAPHSRLQLAQDLLTGVANACGAVVLPFGAWHGDWLPWNLAYSSGGLLVWDWEYWDDCVPVGLDELHYHCGTSFFRDGATLGASFRSACAASEGVLRELGLDARQRVLVSTLYLVEFLLRRLDIATAGGGSDDERIFRDLYAVAFESLSLAAVGGAAD